MDAVKQISIKQPNNTYLSNSIGTDANNVDIDSNHTLADKVSEWNNKVDKVAGKTLSTNDFTDDYKNKIDNLNDSVFTSSEIDEIWNSVSSQEHGDPLSEISEAIIQDINSNIAQDFSELIDYSINDYCLYENQLYKCVIEHPQGAWVNSHFTKTTVMEEIVNMILEDGDDFRY